MISSLSLSPEKSAVSLRWQQTCSMCDCHKWIRAGSRAISLKCIKFSLDIVTQNWCFLKLEQKLLCLQYFTWVYVEMRTCWQCIVLMISLHLVQSSYTDIWAPSLYCRCSESEELLNVLHWQRLGSYSRASSSIYVEFFALSYTVTLYLQAHHLQMKTTLKLTLRHLIMLSVMCSIDQLCRVSWVHWGVTTLLTLWVNWS